VRPSESGGLPSPAESIIRHVLLRAGRSLILAVPTRRQIAGPAVKIRMEADICIYIRAARIALKGRVCPCVGGLS
jgi:hypothetical protein